MSHKSDEDRLTATAVAEASQQNSNIRQFVPRARPARAVGKNAVMPIHAAFKAGEYSGDDDDPGPSAA